MGSSLPFNFVLFFCLNFVVWCCMLPEYIKFLLTLLGLADQGSSLPFSMIFSCTKLIVKSISTLHAHMQGLTCKGSSLRFLSILSSVCPGCSNACQTACQFYLKSVISWGVDLLGQPFPSDQVFVRFYLLMYSKDLIFHSFKWGPNCMGTNLPFIFVPIFLASFCGVEPHAVSVY